MSTSAAAELREATKLPHLLVLLVVGPCDPKISACCMGLGPVDIKRSVNSLYSPSPSPSQGRQNNKTLEKHLLISCAHHQRGGSGQRATKNGSKNERKLKRGKKKTQRNYANTQWSYPFSAFYVRACAWEMATMIWAGVLCAFLIVEEALLSMQSLVFLFAKRCGKFS